VGARARHRELNPRRRGITGAVCKLLGHTRQAFSKGRKARSRKDVDEGLVISLVDGLRATHPQMGARKLLHMLRPDFERAGLDVGRDRLFEILRRNGRLAEPRKSLEPHTTKFDSSLPVSRNWVSKLVVTGPWQALVADITYIRTLCGFTYLTLVTDKFTREIVGWHLSDSLKAEGCLKALEMAAGMAPEGTVAFVHSDRGCQFAGHDFRNALKRLGWISSMTEERHCYENSVAERVNGILKQEYFLDATFSSLAEAESAVGSAVRVYNEFRPHSSIGLMTPAAARMDPQAALPHVRNAEREAAKVHARRMAKARKARAAANEAA